MLNDEGLDLVFRQAHTHNAWQDTEVSATLLRAVYDLARMGPTSANCCPARFVFVTSAEAKERLVKHLMDANVEKTRAAPCTVIVAHDRAFYDKMPELFPARPQMREFFSGNPAFAQETAFRNGSLQGAYFLLAARSLGLDCGPMSGFDNAGLDKEFFPDGQWASNFLCNIGHGDPKGVFPRNPRLSFEDACRIL